MFSGSAAWQGVDDIFCNVHPFRCHRSGHWLRQGFVSTSIPIGKDLDAWRGLLRPEWPAQPTEECVLHGYAKSQDIQSILYIYITGFGLCQRKRSPHNHPQAMILDVSGKKRDCLKEAAGLTPAAFSEATPGSRLPCLSSPPVFQVHCHRDLSMTC